MGANDVTSPGVRYSEPLGSRVSSQGFGVPHPWACDRTINTLKFFATCARGLEKVMAEELRALRAEQIEPGRGGVQFHGDLALLYRANLWLRTAVRVLWPVLEVS